MTSLLPGMRTFPDPASLQHSLQATNISRFCLTHGPHTQTHIAAVQPMAHMHSTDHHCPTHSPHACHTLLPSNPWPVRLPHIVDVHPWPSCMPQTTTIQPMAHTHAVRCCYSIHSPHAYHAWPLSDPRPACTPHTPAIQFTAHTHATYCHCPTQGPQACYKVLPSKPLVHVPLTILVMSV